MTDNSGGPSMKSIVLHVKPEKIALFKAIVESYDNLATVRTEDPASHRLRLYFGADSESEVTRLIDSLASDCELRRLE
ncbi:MAG: DUF4911 domain-containing protein [Candidatus Binataceae bacterium]